MGHPAVGVSAYPTPTPYWIMDLLMDIGCLTLNVTMEMSRILIPTEKEALNQPTWKTFYMPSMV